MKYTRNHFLLLLTVAAFALVGNTAKASTYTMDVNDDAAGFGDYNYDGANGTPANGSDHSYNFSAPIYTTDPTGTSATTTPTFTGYTTTVNYDVTAGTTGNFSVRVDSTFLAGTLDYQLAGLSLTDNTPGYSLSYRNDGGFSPTTFAFNGGTVDVENGAITLGDNIGVTGNYTKTGAGALNFNNNQTVFGSIFGFSMDKFAGTSTITAGSVNYGSNAPLGAASEFVVNGGTLAFNGTDNSNLDGSGTNNTAIVGGVTGTGFSSTAANGSIQVKNNLTPNGMMNVALTGSRALDISTIAAHGLQFDLTAPGSSDEVVVTGGEVNIGTDMIGFDSFDFTGDATAGIYTLIDASNSNFGILGTLNPADLTGTVNGLTGVLTDDGADIILTLADAGPTGPTGPAAAPEPATYALLLGGLAVLLVMRRRAA